MRAFNTLSACVLVAAITLTPIHTAAGQYGTFDFNDGTAQGWWLDGAYDENGNGPFSSNFSFSWWDMVNYPNVPFSDPNGDGNGSAMLFTPSGHGINNPAGTWWIMQFHSPDLSGSSTWQTATGYSVEIADAMSVGWTLYCNLYVKVYDFDQGNDRYFYNGTAQPIQHYQTQAWNYFSFDDWSAIPGFPTNYTVREVFVNIWGPMSGGVDGGVFLDEVVPVSNPPVLSVTPTVLDFGTTYQNLDFYISNVGGGTLVWNVAENPDEPWITSVSPTSGAGDATVTVSVDRSFLVGDSDTGTLSVTSNGGNQDVTVLIERESYVNVTAPQAGEDWPIGSTRHIQWTSSGTSGFVMIEISRDGGSVWTTIEGSTADDGDYVWTVTGPASNNCVIRVTDTDGSPSGTSGTFSISEQPYVTVTSPSTGDDWQIGSQQHIQWTSSGTSGSVIVEISRDGGGTWSTIESSTTDDGDHPWAVTGPASTSCLIRVADTDGDPSGTSGMFTISELPYVTVTSPQAGDDWPIGSEQSIQWTSSGTSGLVMIEISRDGGGTWAAIEPSTTDDGGYPWIVTGPVSTDCVVRVADTDGSPSGESGIFSISEQAYVQVIAPAAGDEWHVGSAQLILWASMGTSGTVAIEISRDGGATWSTIDAGTPDDGDHLWVVSGPLSEDCVIRISDTDGSPEGLSGIFTIYSTAADDPLAPTTLTLDVLGENPTAGPVLLACSTPEPSYVEVTLHDIHGRLLETLHRGWLAAGSHQVRWVPDNGGNVLASGLYVCRLEAGREAVSKVLVLVR